MQTRYRIGDMITLPAAGLTNDGDTAAPEGGQRIGGRHQTLFKEHGFRVSKNAVGISYDNAPMDSF